MVFTRLLPLLFLLPLSSPAPSQDVQTKSVPNTCGVTKPSEHPFVPPRPYLANGINWFGTDKLWTYIPSDGISGQGEKTMWFREEWSHYNHWIPDESASKLTITARRLNVTTPAPKISAGPTFTGDWKAFMLGGINFPTPGCWEITGKYEDAQVQYVVWVVPDAPAKQTQDQGVPLSIIVDKSCRIEPESDPSIVGEHAEAFAMTPFVTLRALLSSHYDEEKITDAQRSRFTVRVAEPEYVVQNPTDKPAVFIVRHDVPEHWIVDSDPQPSSVDGSTAVFRLNAGPAKSLRA